MLKSPPIGVSLSPHRRSSACLVACQLPNHQMVPALRHRTFHHSRSIDNRNEVWTSSSDWNEFALRSNMVIRCRVYAVSGKKKLLCSPLALLLITQAVWVIMTLNFYLHASGSFNSFSFTPVDGYLAQQLPDEILDVFKICVFQRWDLVSYAYFGTALTFGVFSPSTPYSGALKCLTFYTPTSQRYRYSCLLDYRPQRLEKDADWILGDNDPRERHPTRCDAILHNHLFHSILCPVVPV